MREAVLGAGDGGDKVVGRDRPRRVEETDADSNGRGETDVAIEVGWDRRRGRRRRWKRA